MNKIFTRALLTVLVAAPLTVSADSTTKTNDTSKTKTTDTSKTAGDAKAKPAKLKAEELQVMAHYHAVNQMEIDLGNAAAKKGSTDGVKSYGKMLVKDHTEADKDLTSLAKKTGQMIPAYKPVDDTEKKEIADDKAAATKLKTLKGADFDRAYLQMMVQGHEKELSNLDANAAKVENAELADWVKSKKDVLQHHADEARSLQTNTPSASNDMNGMQHDDKGNTTGTGTTGTGSTSGSTNTKTGSPTQKPASPAPTAKR